jgi:hypothetical protein
MGVIVGAALTTAKEWWFDRRPQSKDATFLSIQVIFLIDRFIAGCIEVTMDDGLSYGSPDKEGCKVPQVSHPVFDPTSIDVEWKSLPSNLMYEILNFPLLIEKSNSYIDSVVEHVAGPPDYEEFFDARIAEFSELGLKALSLAETLRKRSKLPDPPENEEGWSRKEILTKAKKQALESTEKRNKANQATWEDISNSKDCA